VTTTQISRPLMPGGKSRSQKVASDHERTSIHLQITNVIRIKHVPRALADRIKNDLTLPNPAYEQAVKMGRYAGNIPQRLELWELDGPALTLPRGYGTTLLRHCRALGITPTVDERRVTLSAVTFDSQINLRPYQVGAVERLVQRIAGGLVAPCGAGKTTVGLEVIARIGQPALVLVHTRELAAQWIDRAVQFLRIPREEIGLIGDGKQSVGTRLTIGLVQTLAKRDLSDIRARFGLVLLDEAHHAPASTFQQVFGAFPARYRLWLSATPERADGLHPILYAVGGPVLHGIDRADLPTITPTLHVVETGFTACEDEYTALLTRLTQDERRNDLIVDAIAAHARGHHSLVLSERVEHVQTLRAMLEASMPTLRIATLTGQMAKRERASVMERVQAREIDVLFATQLAREGLDIAHLDQLFLACPKKAAGALEQECGRIMRPAQEKTAAAVWDFWDSGSPMLRKQFWARRETYGKLGMEVNT
jgi:superfamily II DNA or RNA helicase